MNNNNYIDSEDSGINKDFNAQLFYKSKNLINPKQIKSKKYKIITILGAISGSSLITIMVMWQFLNYLFNDIEKKDNNILISDKDVKIKYDQYQIYDRLESKKPDIKKNNLAEDIKDINNQVASNKSIAINVDNDKSQIYANQPINNEDKLENNNINLISNNKQNKIIKSDNNLTQQDKTEDNIVPKPEFLNNNNIQLNNSKTKAPDNSQKTINTIEKPSTKTKQKIVLSKLEKNDKVFDTSPKLIKRDNIGLGTHGVQILSLTTQKYIPEAWDRVKNFYFIKQKKYKLNVATFSDINNNKFYRLRIVGIASKKAANKLCKQLNQKSMGCFYIGVIK